ncbi:MAG TPA: hypothetical protein VMZ53_31090 [Kofleriaceae bacterium]|nr:hypothetical protein [Kofleriaceae bacterium]
MKRRWTVLFYCALGSLIGMSWLAKSLDISLGSFWGVSLMGMIAASGVAFFAMWRNVPDKWPAAIVLTCAGPMILDVLRTIRELPMILRFFGPSIALVVIGAVATAGVSIAILVMQPPRPAAPPVAPARVVD